MLTPLVVIVLGFVLTGCASIIHGTTQDVGIASTPSGVTFSINNGPTITTPAKMTLKRNETHLLTFEHPGYESASATIVPTVSGWVWGNLLFGGLIGLMIDAGWGGMYTLEPEEVSVTLPPLLPPMIPGPPIPPALILPQPPPTEEVPRT